MKFLKRGASLGLAAVMAWSMSVSAASVKSAVSDGETLTVTITSDESETARVYYKDADGSVSMAEAALTSGDTVVTLAGSDGGTLYVWDENMRPLTDVFSEIELSAEEATESEEATETEETGDGIIHLLGSSVNATGVENVEVDGTTVTITAAGEYTFEGKLYDGQIVVSDDVGKKDSVTINLNGVTVASSTSAPFNAANGIITIVLGDDTVNTFVDTADYTTYTTSKAPKGCFYSKRDMDITGAGTLVVNANVKNGIVCGADLSVKKNASITVTALNNAIKGDNSVSFTAKTGTVTVYAAEGDAIKSDAIDSDTGYIEDGKGTVEIKGGTFVLEAPFGDGIQADASVTISGGTLEITSGTEGIKANEVRLVTIDDDDNVLDTVPHASLPI
ncbi:MAG: carbohydrate-binding domain-containing protein [Clostridia bacterium]|nr:carbohydrate-binding domain-containing protein [Clostridia bacterium]